ncbi:MAG: type II toxin-antitoxin system VapC family toxin [Fibrobacterota bacterium]
MKQSVYLETSVVSYLTSRISGDLVVAGHQQLTRLWWDQQKHNFNVFVSEFVVREASAGDAEASRKRMEVLRGIPVLGGSPEIEALALGFLKNGHVPVKGAVDAFHIATATIHEIDYLLTWNCTHIANAVIRSYLALEADKAGYRLPIICTPEELWGGLNV